MEGWGAGLGARSLYGSPTLFLTALDPYPKYESDTGGMGAATVFMNQSGSNPKRIGDSRKRYITYTRKMIQRNI